MPCYDERSSASYVHEHEVRPLRQERDKIQAMLCGIMKALHKNNLLIPILTQYDAKEAGIPQNEVLDWWMRHMMRDMDAAQEEE